MMQIVLEVRDHEGRLYKSEQRVVDEAQYVEILMSIDTFNKIIGDKLSFHCFVVN